MFVVKPPLVYFLRQEDEKERKKERERERERLCERVRE
jgi:hypothetical protein